MFHVRSYSFIWIICFPFECALVMFWESKSQTRAIENGLNALILSTPTPFQPQPGQSRAQSPQASWSKRWLPGETLGQWKCSGKCYSRNLQFTVLSFVTTNQVSTGDHPLTKKPEDSGYEIAICWKEPLISSLSG